MQDALIHQVAGFMATDPMAQNMSAAEISIILHEKLKETMGKSATIKGWQQRLYDHNGLPNSPTL
jgi:hypothetical protein